ncbi:hypothetical protein COB64_01575 [Candidatus Wolfebacteria bacterium]|nr:MAG: hypothetical protein COB64_01575 [Candidatus Wolfebacteria bacterium]
MLKKRSFFERLTGSVKLEDDNELELDEQEIDLDNVLEENDNWVEEVGELSVDVFETPTDIVVKAMVAGVRPDELTINISRDSLTVEGHREESSTVSEDNYYSRELYWGSFSRTIALPHEVEPDQAVATEKHGLLILKIPRIDKEKKATVKIKSI